VTESTWKHELACAEIFIALYKSGVTFKWRAVDDKERGFQCDREALIAGQQIFFEFESGSQYYKRDKVIKKKLEQYMKLDEWFHVIFMHVDSENSSATDYAHEVMEIIKEYEKEKGSVGSRFYTTLFDLFTIDPLGQVLLDKNKQPCSLETLPEPRS
jgi:hypothetical protein